MARKSLDDLRKEHDDLLAKAAATEKSIKMAVEDEAGKAKTELDKSLVAYNNLAKEAGWKLLKITSDEAGKVQGSRGSKRLRLADETRADITDKIIKAAKAHKAGGASKPDLIKYLDISGYKLGVNYNELHLFAILNTLRSGDEPQITTTGEKSKMRYHAA